MPRGRQKVKLTARNPPLDETLEIEVKDKDVTRQIGVGVVEADGDLMLQQGHHTVHKLATLEGRQSVVVVDPKTGESSKKSVVVPAGGTVKIGAR